MTEETLATPAGALDVPETTEAVTATDATQAPQTTETPEATETPTEATPEAATDVEAQATEEQPEPEQKKVNPVQKRIDDITAKRREAERTAKQLEDHNKRLQEKLAKYETPEPTLEGFDFDEHRYQAALNRWNMDQFRKEDIAEQAEDSKRNLEAAKSAEQQSTVQAYQIRAQQFASQAPDFETVVTSSQVQLSETVQEQILSSDYGPQIAYYMAKNPMEAAEIAMLDKPLDAARALGRLESRLSQAPPKRVTQAPTPMKPIAGSTGSRPDFDPSSSSVDDYAAVLKKAGVI